MSKNEEEPKTPPEETVIEGLRRTSKVRIVESNYPIPLTRVKGKPDPEVLSFRVLTGPLSIDNGGDTPEEPVLDTETSQLGGDHLDKNA